MSIVEETCRFLRSNKMKKVGVVGSKATISMKLYENSLQSFGIECIIPGAEEQEILLRIIYSILAGNKKAVDGKALLSIARTMYKKGAECIILGCTEFSLLRLNSIEFKLVDTVKILAKSVVFFCKDGGKQAL